MAKDTLQPRFIVPAFVESFEDVDHLWLVESIEMRHYSIQFGNIIFLLVRS